MKALFPVFCRPLGYVVLLVALFLLPILLMQGLITDHNLLFYKECTKLLMMAGCLLIIFALSKNESRETEHIRNAAVRNAVFLTFLFVFGGMLYREGMPGSILFAGICAVVYFVVGIRFGNELMADDCTSIGEFSVLLLIVILSALLVNSYCKKASVVWIS